MSPSSQRSSSELGEGPPRDSAAFLHFSTLSDLARTTAERGVALAILGVLGPGLAAVAATIKLTSPGPVLYSSRRIGRHGREFLMKKFRSMVKDAPMRVDGDAKTVVEANDPRLTPIGRILRMGWDELPQLINVLRGEMSLVGPRPDPSWMRPFYTENISVRLDARPGVTGLAQVLDSRSYTTATGYLLDAYYLHHRNLLLDAAILAATVPFVLKLRFFCRPVLDRVLRSTTLRPEQFEPLPFDPTQVSGA